MQSRGGDVRLYVGVKRNVGALQGKPTRGKQREAGRERQCSAPCLRPIERSYAARARVRKKEKERVAGLSVAQLQRDLGGGDSESA